MAKQLKMSLRIALDKRTKKQKEDEKKFLRRIRRVVSKITEVPPWYLEFLKLPMQMEKHGSRNIKHSFDIGQFISLHQSNWEYHLHIVVNDCSAKKAQKLCKKYKIDIKKKDILMKHCHAISIEEIAI